MKATTGELRKQLIEEIIRLHTDGELTLGMAIRRLRLEITGFDQDTFAQMCGMSTRALYQLETDKGNPTLSTVDRYCVSLGYGWDLWLQRLQTEAALLLANAAAYLKSPTPSQGERSLKGELETGLELARRKSPQPPVPRSEA